MDELQWGETLAYHLETLNGVFVILVASAVAWLAYYILEQKNLEGLTWRQVLGSHGPLGVRLATPMLVLKTGLLIRALVWSWHELGPGHTDLLVSHFVVIIIGSFLVIIGFLCLIRVLTQHRFGHWPWLLAGVLVLLYVILSNILFWYGIEG
jgi:hypothetical protein